MPFEALGDKVIVEPIAGPEKVGNIYLTDTEKEKPSQMGSVVSVGPGRQREDGYYVPLPVGVGDVVLYGKWSGVDLESEGRKYKVLDRADILARKLAS